MRAFTLFVATLLLLGCISLEDRTNATEENLTNATGMNYTNVTEPAPKQWERYNVTNQSGTVFSFWYPANMDVDDDPGFLFIGTHSLDGQTSEAMFVRYLDTVHGYGENKDKEFRQNPSKAASDLLASDIKEDPVGVLNYAEEVGNMTTYGIERDVYAAEVPFTILDEGVKKTGYAIDLYVPELSFLVKFRVYAIDPANAKKIKDQFLLSFRIE